MLERGFLTEERNLALAELDQSRGRQRHPNEQKRNCSHMWKFGKDVLLPANYFNRLPGRVQGHEAAAVRQAQ